MGQGKGFDGVRLFLKNSALWKKNSAWRKNNSAYRLIGMPNSLIFIYCCSK